MFFRSSEKQSVLNLSVESSVSGELTAGILTAANATLSTEEKVKQYFEQMREPLFRYLTSTFGGEHAQAEEVAQDAFIQLYRYMAGGHPIQNVRAWTFRVAHNLAINKLKRQQFIAPLSDEDWDDLQRTLDSKDLNPEQSLLQKEKLTRLSKAIGRLTEVERQCLNLRTKGFRYREIGEILELTTRQVAGTLYRVIEKLAKETND